MQNTDYTYLDASPPPADVAGPLHGMSLAVQPNLSVLGWPTDAGSRALEGFTAIYNATVIERLRLAGAHIKGSTRMSELGFGLAGDTGATALNNSDVDALLVTDTMGEARMTACLARGFGFKPSYGLVSRFGLIGLIPSMECCGMAAKQLPDIARAMAVMAETDSRDLSMPAFDAGLAFPRFDRAIATRTPVGSCGVVQECLDQLDPEESRAFNAAKDRLAGHGIEINSVHLKDFELARTVHNVMGAVEASSSAGKYDGVRYGHRTETSKNWNDMYLNSRAESFGALLKTYLFQGAYFQYENYDAFVDAARIRARLLAQTDAALADCDVLLLPARRAALDPAGAATINDVYDVFAWTLLPNLTGHPAMSLPGRVICKDTDLGLQLIGPRFQDHCLLAVAARLTALDTEAHDHGV
jgi:aspartyl-tRNA(Asn)/glutamyl-tRNA(Gln) amidotransferase subunit A